MVGLLALSWFPVDARAAKPADATLIYVLTAKNKETDGAFIAAARRGAARAADELGVTYDEIKLLGSEDVASTLENLAKNGREHIVAVGYQNVMPVLSLAERYPNTKFTVVDGLVPPLFHNVQSIIFKDHEGSFLVGMLAAMKTKTNHIGFVGGVDIPLIRNFAHGFEQGIHFINPNINLTIDMIGKDSSAWGDAGKAETLAKKQYGEKIDVIFAAAGAAGLGVLKAAHDTGNFAIGVDINQNDVYPGSVLTSMVKRVDVAVFETLKLVHNKEWNPGIKYLGVKEDALDYAVDEHNRGLISPEMIDKVSAARERIANGSLSVQMYSPR